MRGVEAIVASAFALALPSVAHAGGQPNDVGPFEVQTDVYDDGDEAFGAPGFGAPAELRAVVYSPTELDQGPFPLVIFLHGRHATCYDPANPGGTPGDGSFLGAFMEWPCSGNRVPIPSHEGYETAGKILASHGYIVVSVSANGINAADNNIEDGGADARGQLIVAHLNRWAEFAGSGAEPFDDKYLGAVDLERIGLMGHSRGGEGVARAIGIDQENGNVIGIDAALLLAPVDFNRTVLSHVPLAVVLPYCDGDVSDLQGAHYYDDARYAEPGDLAAKYIFSMYGANHNYFNTVWSPSTFEAGTADDFGQLAEAFGSLDPACSEGPGSSRLTEGQQRQTLDAYSSAFFRRHLGGDTQFDDILRGNVLPQAAGAPVFTTYSAPDDGLERLDVNPLDDDAALTTNLLGEAVTAEGLDLYDLCGLADRNEIVDHCIDELGEFMGMPFETRQPHTPGLGQLRIAFGPGSTWDNALPAGTDVSELQYLQFRVGPDYEGPMGAGVGVEMSAVLTDAAGSSMALDVQSYTDALDAAPGSLAPILPKKMLHGVRIPLADFDGVDLTDLASVALAFDGAAGGVLLSDLAFSDAVIDEPGGTGTGTDSGGSDDDALDDTGGTDDGVAGTAGTTGGEPNGAGSETGEPTQDGSGDEGCACRAAPSGRPHSWGWLTFFALGLARRRRGPSLRP